MSDLRASDADREAIAEVLRAHHTAGRIDDEELEERLETAFGARTVGDLAALTRDLPHTRRVAAIDPEENRVRGFGTRSFRQQYDIPGDEHGVWEGIVKHVVPALVETGYDIETLAEPDLIVLDLRERSPGWMLFGTLAYLSSERSSKIVFSLSPVSSDLTRMTITGRAPRTVRKWLAKFGEMN